MNERMAFQRRSYRWAVAICLLVVVAGYIVLCGLLLM
jgi:uncharacterized membrane protein (DUF485 family)